METLAATNTNDRLTGLKMTVNDRPKRRPRPGLSRRASMSSLPSYKDKSDKQFGFNKKELQAAYKEEKKLRKKAHADAEKNFNKTMDDLNKFKPKLSGLAEQEETMASKVNLETFDRPKASRKSRRASLNLTLRLLTPPSTPKVELEEIQHFEMDPLAMPALPAPPINRRGMLKKSMSCHLDAEALAGWKTIKFHDGPLGIQLEPTVGEKAARVTGFRNAGGVPSAARATGKIQFNDIVVKVNDKVPKTYEESLALLGQGGVRNITFRPAFDYEVDAEGLRRSKKKREKKEKKKKDKKKDKKKKKKKDKDKLSKSSKHKSKFTEEENKEEDKEAEKVKDAEESKNEEGSPEVDEDGDDSSSDSDSSSGSDCTALR